MMTSHEATAHHILSHAPPSQTLAAGTQQTADAGSTPRTILSSSSSSSTTTTTTQTVRVTKTTPSVNGALFFK
jgi:hypothetical protein